MKSILFTKALNPKKVQKILGDSCMFDYKNFIQIKKLNKQIIKAQLKDSTNFYLISSARAAKQIKDFKLPHPFYVVGEKSKRILEDSDHKVAFCAPTAQDLLDHINNNLTTNQTFTFFCSNIRRDTLPFGLQNLGHIVNEIVCYETHSKQVRLEKEYDLYVFFSPSGVKSFAQQYEIPKKASIFAIGKTTSEAVLTELDLDAEFPEIADVKSLLQLIKYRLDAEK